MSSIAAFVHSAHTAALAFNSDFYTTAAAVIATLFVALAVQHGAVEDALTLVATASRERNPNMTFTPLVLTAAAVAYFILGITALAEGCAILAVLYYRDPIGYRIIVITAMVALIMAVSFVPALQIGRTLIGSAHLQPGGSQPGAWPNGTNRT